MASLVVVTSAGADDLVRNGLRIRTSRSTGLATFVTPADNIPIPLAAARGAAQPTALDFVNAYGGLFGVADPATQLVASAAVTDTLGHTHTKYEQVHQGVEVFGGVLIVHQNATGALVAANGHFFPIPTALKTRPVIAIEQAIAKAVGEIERGAPTVESSRLVIVDPGWYGDPIAGAHLAYYLVLSDIPAGVREAFFIDAVTGKPLDRWNLLHTARDRVIIDDVLEEVVRTEGGAATGDTEADWGYDYTGDLYDYLFRGLGRDSIDGAGATLFTTVHLQSGSCPNAFGGAGGTFFCDGVLTDDIVAHEYGHGFIAYTANLVYQNQPGQLNESYCDVLGEVVDLLNGNAAFPGPPGGTAWPTHDSGPGTDTPNTMRSGCTDAGESVRWLMGEDSEAFGGAIRDMWQPSCAGHPDHANHPFQTCNPFDNGGVHSGSGVPNHAFAMLTDGKSFNGETVNAIGLFKAAAVWFRALSTYLSVTSDFEDAYAALNQSALDLEGTTIMDPRDGTPFDVFTAGDSVEVDKALRAAEMNTRGACGSTVNCMSSSAPSPNLVTTTNRYLTFSAGDVDQHQAVRVTFVDLPGAHAAWNGRTMFVDQPRDVSELGGKTDDTPPTFKAAGLRCSRTVVDWNEVGTVYVSHAAIVPGGVYDIQVVGEGCSVDVEASFSPALRVTPNRWGDVTGVFDAGAWEEPDGTIDVAFDIVAILEKFKSLPTAPLKARVDLSPGTPDREITILDLVEALNAFKGAEYPFAPGPPPCGG